MVLQELEQRVVAWTHAEVGKVACGEDSELGCEVGA